MVEIKGLIIKPKWADLILNGNKTMEIRSKNTNIRGTIGIIKSGTKKIWGTVQLFNCMELNRKNFEKYKNQHKLEISYDELLKIYSKPYIWCLRNVKIFKNPLPYEHKRGCVVWVNC